MEKRDQIFEELMNLTDKIKGKLEIKERFQKSTNLFQSINYKYSTNAIYGKFNQILSTFLFACILSQEKEKIIKKFYIEALHERL